jgi:glucosylceramidase
MKMRRVLVLNQHRLKIPYILWAKELSEKEIKFFGSPWSPPTWMKSNGHCAGLLNYHSFNTQPKKMKPN